MKPIRIYREQLELARIAGEEQFLNKLYEEAFQHGVERGKFEERTKQHSGEKSK